VANLLSKTEIDVLMGAISSGEVPTRGRRRKLPNMGSMPLKDTKAYDFRHPVLLLKDQLRALQAIHEDLARQLTGALSSYFRVATHVKCMRVDQISYGEFAQSLPDPCTVVKLRLQPSENRMLLAIQPPLANGALDKTSGGVGVPDALTRPFTEIECVIIGNLLAVMVRELEPAWKRALRLSFLLEALEHSIEFCQIARREEMVAAVSLEVLFGETQGLFNLCYPFRALRPFIDKLSAKDWAHEEQKADAALPKGGMEAVIGGIPLRVSARLGTAQIVMQDLLQIKRGDVLILNRTIDQPIDIEVGGRPRFTGHMGMHHGKKAILIKERMG